ncbi:hypothetical protein [uncultured Psychrosphaera sp.]|uniref:hypothetical protein n=1 Tax=uncultured Psychrosphaera sp. TaxID=1403522 RepID=UPI00262DABEA|nr:hypothetical protein [uncultured Psychrosphaera sp.]
MASAFSGIKRTGRQDSSQQSIIENVELLTGQRGGGLNRALLYSDLVNLNQLQKQALAKSITSNKTNPGGLPISNVGIERPHKPVNFTGQGGFTFIALQWDQPTYRGHAYTEIYRSDSDDFSTAVRIATEVTTIFSDQVNMGAMYYYWIKFVNEVDMAGPISGADGLEVQTQESAEHILNEIGGMIEKSHLSNFFGQSLEDENENIDIIAENIISTALNGDVNAMVELSRQAVFLEETEQLSNDIYATSRKLSLLRSSFDNAQATIINDYYTKASANEAISQASTTLKSEIEDENGNSVAANLKTLSETVATNDEQWAMWAVKTQVGDITSSFGLVNDGRYPIFAIKGAKLAVITTQDPEDLTPIFSVVDDKTVMTNALIDQAFIQSLVTDELLSNRITVDSIFKTPSINYDPETGVRSNNFSIDPNGNMVAKSAVLDTATLHSVTIKDSAGNTVFSSSGKISSSNVDGLSLAITTKITSAYVKNLLANQILASSIYAKNIEGDVYDLRHYGTRSSVIQTIKISAQSTQIFAGAINTSDIAKQLVIGAVAIEVNGFKADYDETNDVSVYLEYYLGSVKKYTSTTQIVSSYDFEEVTKLLIFPSVSPISVSKQTSNTAFSVKVITDATRTVKAGQIKLAESVPVSSFIPGTSLS